MKYLVIFAFAALGLSQLPAQDKFDYATAIKLATERAQLKAPAGSFILVFGPEQTEEVYQSNGKEEKRTVPYCRACDPQEGSFIERLICNGVNGGHILDPNSQDIYQLSVYRSDGTNPVVQIKGDKSTFYISQFPLKAGDVVRIRNLGEKKQK